ncbi:unnamed protein product [Cyclocybe aegerita]|uniref:Uncharacterized protein n=1 Tax=Cyclocybe aegerita TaxID=1973307 RepID=A0A8S0XLV4_CYCAE|nr:unnamed protein product [Cyclocybe aegerita]
MYLGFAILEKDADAINLDGGNHSVIAEPVDPQLLQKRFLAYQNRFKQSQQLEDLNAAIKYAEATLDALETGTSQFLDTTIALINLFLERHVKTPTTAAPLRRVIQF